MEKEDLVTITRDEYERLQRSEDFLSCLEACGVDNWSGYGDAQEMFEDEKED